jgi:hypothetical protein
LRRVAALCSTEAFFGFVDNGGKKHAARHDTVVFANSRDPCAKGFSKSSSPLGENLQENEWLVQIRAESGDYADNVNYFGVRKEASAEQDVYDWYEPPVIPGGFSVNFPHAEWQNPASFTSDIRPITKDGYKWQIRINASGGTAVTLIFTQLEPRFCIVKLKLPPN